MSHLDFLTTTSKTFKLITTNYSEVFTLLSKLTKSKASGLDEIPARLIRECPDLIADSLVVFSISPLLVSFFVDEWKCSKVIPLFRQG